MATMTLGHRDPARIYEVWSVDMYETFMHGKFATKAEARDYIQAQPSEDRDLFEVKTTIPVTVRKD
jgi:hypothetical protein